MSVLDILQHALGVDQFGRGTMYRDHFVAEPGHSDYDTCQDAVADGLMRRYENRYVIGGVIFIVTDAGKAFVLSRSPKPPKSQRAKDRYSRWLDLSDVISDLTFGDFLRREKEFS